MTFALAVDSDFSLNPFSESAFHSGNASLEISPSALSFAQLMPRQQECAIPGDHVCPSGVAALPPRIVCPTAAVRSNLKLAAAQAVMPLALPAVPAMPALVPTTVY